MGIRDEVVFEERLRRKFRIIAEAERCGSRVVRAAESDEGSAGYAFDNGALRHFYGEIQRPGAGFAGLFVEPGEHHALLPFHAPQPATYLVDKPMWWSDDARFAAALGQTEAALGLGQKDWRWHPHRGQRGGGAFYRAEWCVEIAPSPFGGTHLVMRALEGDDANPVGFALFSRIARALQSVLELAQAGRPAPTTFPTTFGGVAPQQLRDERLFRSPEPARDVARDVTAMLGSIRSRDVTMGHLPPKRAELARAAVPDAAAHLPLLGVLGNRGVLGPADVLAVTPTHGFVLFEGVRTALPWSEVVDAQASGSDRATCLLRSTRVGWVPIPGCGHARALAEGFRALAAAS